MNLRAKSSIAILILATPIFAGDLSMPLIWKPTTRIAELEVPPINFAPFQGVKIAVGKLEDGRQDKTVVGANLENSKPRYVRATGDVPEFLATHLKGTLKDLGFPVVDAAGEATVVITGEILAYSVEEREVYVGDLRIKISVKAGDKLLWQSVASGANKRFGRSFKDENYQETLSDTVLDCVARLAKDPAFVAALAHKP